MFDAYIDHPSPAHDGHGLSIVHRSDQLGCRAVLDYSAGVLDMGFQRHLRAFQNALETDHTFIKKVDGAVDAVSLPIPQMYIGRGPRVAVMSELLFHHIDPLEGRKFLRAGVLPRQPALLRHRAPEAEIYTVVRECNGYAEVLEEHGWHRFEPHLELVRCREQTGAIWRADEIWLKA